MRVCCGINISVSEFFRFVSFVFVYGFVNDYLLRVYWGWGYNSKYNVVFVIMKYSLIV